MTDKSGIFTFQKLEPGSYIVEIMADDQSILAASELAQRERRSSCVGSRQAAVPHSAVRGCCWRHQPAVGAG